MLLLEGPPYRPINGAYSDAESLRELRIAQPLFEVESRNLPAFIRCKAGWTTYGAFVSLHISSPPNRNRHQGRQTSC